jgi:hypothetical protein
MDKNDTSDLRFSFHNFNLFSVIVITYQWLVQACFTLGSFYFLGHARELCIKRSFALDWQYLPRHNEN